METTMAETGGDLAQTDITVAVGFYFVNHIFPGTLTDAYFEISAALAKGRRILVVNRVELEGFLHTDEIVELLKLKILELTTLSTLR